MMEKTLPKKQAPGFALIVTLSLMILLTVIAVGLLSLSSISLRATSQGSAMATAQANARMALMLALGELQTQAGPDTRITATGAIFEDSTESKQHLTGVWESWKIDPSQPPTASDYEKADGKQKRFKKWLVSYSDPRAIEQQDFVSSSEFPAKERVTLVPELKTAGDNGSTTSAVYGGLVPLAPKDSGRTSGALAYAVFDEGVKVRIDTGYKPEKKTQLGDLATTLGTGVRADVSRIKGLEKINWEAADLSKSDNSLHKAVSFSSGGLMLESLSGNRGTKYNALFHDITTESIGIFTDVANGGLKQDLNSILNAETLPADFSGSVNSKLYSKHLEYPVAKADATTGQIEPSWEQLFRFSNYYKTDMKDSKGPTVAMQRPADSWTNPTQPPALDTKNVSLMPTLLKMQMFYSLIAVPMWADGSMPPSPPTGNWTEPESGHVGWQTTAWASGARYFLQVCMSPVVTIHNPYNSNLEVKDLSVELNNIPMAIQVNRNGQGWVPKDGQSVDNLDTEGAQNGAKNLGKKFRFNLTEDGSNTGFTLAPGEVRVFSPTAPSTTTYQTNPYRSWNSFTTPDPDPMILKRGFRGVTIGYYVSRLSANEMSGYETYPNGKGRGSLEYLAPSDKIQARVRPCLDKRISSSVAEMGVCKVSLVKVGSKTTNPVIYSQINVNVGSDSTDGNLLNSLETSLNLSPSSGEIATPKLTSQMAGMSGNQPLNTMNAYTFGVLTISAKTTYGNYEQKNYDGIMGAKPMAFHSIVTPFTALDVGKIGLGPYPYEVGVIPLQSDSGTGYENLVDINEYGRGYGISGLSSLKGQQFGTIYEIPTGPLQNFAQLNSANIAATNSLARFTYPIGNSWAHPMIPPTALTQAPVLGRATSYDHSFLLNLLLYDKFYFSGITSHQGKFMKSVSASDLANSFVKDSDSSEIQDKRLMSYLPDGETEADAIAALSVANQSSSSQPQARYDAASHQLMKGAFNVNSTSKEAWKAILASLHSPNGKMFLSDQTRETAAVSNLKPANDSKVRFSRFMVPNNNAATSSDEAQNVFQGPRDISEGQLDQLADAIVKQVRARGPFLSMGEFVNRQLGSSELAQKGALQAAIDVTEINSSSSDSVLAATGYVLPSPTIKYTNPVAMEGRSDQGAAGFLSQADLLSALGNAVTVRSDTFRIRAYGETRDASGKVVAQAWCEAVVQRMPEYVSSEDKSNVAIANLTSQANRVFGRKFFVKSFRWVPASEFSSPAPAI